MKHRSPASQRIAVLAISIALSTSRVAAAAESGTTTQFDIPAQPLGSALTAFADKAGIKLMFESALAQGLRSNTVSGNLSRQEALSRLLEGSGLSYRFTNDNTVTLERRPATAPKVNQTDPTALPRVKVTGKAVYDADDPYNPGYTRSHSSTATRTDTPIIETPASIQVVPQAVLKDQQAISLTDGLRNVSGVQLSYSPTYENFTIRGFDMNGATYRNGIREASWAAETANVERLEVLKGPGAMLYGRIEPGGMVNRVTKKPLDAPYYSLQQQFGSFDNYRTTADATGPITSDGSLAYRFNLAYQNTKSYRDLFFRDRIFIAPAIRWRISDRTEVNFGMEYQNDDFRWDNGFPVLNGANRPADLPVNRSLSDPKAYASQERKVVDFNWSHQFNDDWKISQQFSSFLGGRIQYDIFPFGIHADQRTVDRFNWNNRVINSDTYSFNTNLLGHFDTWGVRHTVLLGHDYYQLQDQAEGRCCATVDSIDIYNPRPFQGTIPLVPASFGYYRQEWNGAYFQDQMVFWDKLHLLGGGRYDWASYGVSSSPISYSDSRRLLNGNMVRAEKFSPRVGLLYHPWDWFSVYGSYTESLGANNTYAGKNPDGTPLKPQEATQYEAGIKTEFFDKRLTASMAYFDLVKTNVAAGHPDPALALLGYAVTVGEARSRGIEVDVAGQIDENWSVIANYAYLDTKITKFSESDVFGGVSLLGKKFPNAPSHSANLWGKYEFTDSLLKGLSLGSGLRIVSQRQGDPQNSFQLPGYVNWDAMAAYSVHVGPTKLTAQFNVYNLLDKRYFASADTFDASQRFYGNVPGAPRSFVGSIRVEY